ncbi:hypothetical protein ABZT03_35880 [Streptomyces sp. NPDC005574]|uniref:hypothetical protein n=1 Tax=Streptomyces sp. NPDC005574 TaxID=3156891 RepID=UPI0033A90AC8
MGERHSGGDPGRRRAHPEDLAEPHDTAGLEELLTGAGVADVPDAEAEQRAVDAFRTARDTGAHRARTRRRDDWRPREQRAARPVRLALSLALASLTLGGAAVAAIGSYDSTPGGSADDRPRPGPTSSAPAGVAPVPPAAASTGADGLVAARDTEAYCRAYGKAHGRQRSLDPAAWQRLVAAAGGEREVTAYCARRLTAADATTGGGKKTDKAAKASEKAADQAAKAAEKAEKEASKAAAKAEKDAAKASAKAEKQAEKQAEKKKAGASGEGDGG